MKHRIICNIEKWLFYLYKIIAINSLNKQTTILNFHRVLDVKNISMGTEEAISVDEFYLKMKLLKEHFNVISLPELIERQSQTKEFEPLSVVVTIDDGYEDGYYNICPILDEFKIKGAFFITTEGIENGHLWKDKIKNAIFRSNKVMLSGFSFIPNLPLDNFNNKRFAKTKFHNYSKYLTIKERDKLINQLIESLDVDISDNIFLSKNHLREMHQSGMTIGSHTHRHPILSREENIVAQGEISKSKYILEQILNDTVEYFAYPNGKKQIDFTCVHEDMIKKLGFTAALSTDWGCVNNTTNLFSVPRYTPWDKHEYRFGIRLINHSKKVF